MTTPRIGRPARGSRTGRPIMVALDLLGRRMTLRIVWELHSAPLNFRDLQDACQTNSALLNTRLKELRETGLVDHLGEGYCLTPAGIDLVDALQPLARWAGVWRKNFDPPR